MTKIGTEIGAVIPAIPPTTIPIDISYDNFINFIKISPTQNISVSKLNRNELSVQIIL